MSLNEMRNKDRQEGTQSKLKDIVERGMITMIFPEREYGFIKQEDGQQVFFHSNEIVIGDFKDMYEGQMVEYVVVLRPKGLSASLVTVI